MSAGATYVHSILLVDNKRVSISKGPHAISSRQWKEINSRQGEIIEEFLVSERDLTGGMNVQTNSTVVFAF